MVLYDVLLNIIFFLFEEGFAHWHISWISGFPTYPLRTYALRATDQLMDYGRLCACQSRIMDCAILPKKKLNKLYMYIYHYHTYEWIITSN